MQAQLSDIKAELREVKAASASYATTFRSEVLQEVTRVLTEHDESQLTEAQVKAIAATILAKIDEIAPPARDAPAHASGPDVTTLDSRLVAIEQSLTQLRDQRSRETTRELMDTRVDNRIDHSEVEKVVPAPALMGEQPDLLPIQAELHEIKQTLAKV